MSGIWNSFKSEFTVIPPPVDPGDGGTAVMYGQRMYGEGMYTDNDPDGGFIPGVDEVYSTGIWAAEKEGF